MSILNKARQIQATLPAAGAAPPSVGACDQSDISDQRPLPQSPFPRAGSDRSPPPGVRLFFGNEHGRPCLPGDAWHWTWEGGPAWFYTADRIVPPCEPVLAPHSGVRCQRCVRRALRLSWHVFADGNRHLRCDCLVCGAHVKYIPKPDPWLNVDLEFRTPAGAPGTDQPAGPRAG